MRSRGSLVRGFAWPCERQRGIVVGIHIRPIRVVCGSGQGCQGVGARANGYRFCDNTGSRRIIGNWKVR